MKQYEQVIDAMRKRGGYATLGYLNQNVDVSKWGTRTPYASIRRIVQDDRYFFKISPGLWALKEFKDEVLKRIDLPDTPQSNEIFSHTYFQGLLVEIGNLRGFDTYIPPQDKNNLFLENKLGSISTVDKIFDFTYPEIIRRARTVDVIWFNERSLPDSFFEVEHSTDFINSFTKFHDLQDFYSKFFILSSHQRRPEFDDKITRSSFKGIRDRIRFIDYEFISNLHTKTFELERIGKL